MTVTNKAVTAAYLQCLNGFCMYHGTCYLNTLQLKYTVYSRELSVLSEIQFSLYYSNWNQQNIKYSKLLFAFETLGS